MPYKIGQILTEVQATEISPAYVQSTKHDWKALYTILDAFNNVKKGGFVLTLAPDRKHFVVAKVSSKNYTPYAEDGPVVRVSDGKQSWRVDGNTYCVPI